MQKQKGLGKRRYDTIERITGKRMVSVLKVTVIEGRNLIPMDVNGLSDPYVHLQVGDQEIETQYQANTLNPIWNETFTFQVKPNNPNLVITVYDYDSMSSTPDFEGMVVIPLKSLQGGEID